MNSALSGLKGGCVCIAKGGLRLFGAGLALQRAEAAEITAICARFIARAGDALAQPTICKRSERVCKILHTQAIQTPEGK